MKIGTLSPSSINLFYSCPKRWYFERTGAPQIIVDESAKLFGKFVHNILQSYFTSLKGIPTVLEVEQKLTKLFEEYYDEKLLAIKYFNNEKHVKHSFVTTKQMDIRYCVKSLESKITKVEIKINTGIDAKDYKAIA